MYLHLLDKRDNKNLQDVLKYIRKFYNRESNGYVSYEEFKGYYLKIVSMHIRCDEDCPHLRRFYAKIGFTTLHYQRRRELKIPKHKPLLFSVNT